MNSNETIFSRFIESGPFEEVYDRSIMSSIFDEETDDLFYPSNAELWSCVVEEHIDTRPA